MTEQPAHLSMMFRCPAYDYMTVRQCVRNRAREDIGARACKGCEVAPKVDAGKVAMCTVDEYRAGQRPGGGTAKPIDASPPPKQVYVEDVYRAVKGGDLTTQALAASLKVPVDDLLPRLERWAGSGLLTMRTSGSTTLWSKPLTDLPPEEEPAAPQQPPAWEGDGRSFDASREGRARNQDAEASAALAAEADRDGTGSRPEGPNRTPTTREAILAWMQANPGEWQATEIAHGTGRPISSVSSWCSRLCGSGVLADDGTAYKRRYHLADEAATKPAADTTPTLRPQAAATFPPMGPKPDGTGQVVLQRRNAAEGSGVTALNHLMDCYRDKARMDMLLAESVLPFDPEWPEELKAKHRRIREFVVQELER